MWRENRIVIIFIAAVMLLGIAFYFAAGSDEDAAKHVVTGFGKQLQKVSLLGPDASSTMASAYGPYVDSTLLTQWQKDPKNAPGKLVSSPWPDRIEIVSLTKQGAGFAIQGAVVLITSKDVGKNTYSGFVPVMVQVIPEGNGWRIAAFQEQATTTTAQ